MGSLVVRGHLKRAARTGTGLFKNEGNVLAFEALDLGSGLLGFFELCGQVQEILDLLRGKIQQFEKMAVV
jgi:hypothetical protein